MIPDGEFIRAEGVPMTKEEVRAVALYKLRLRPGLRLIDVGCGTGTIAVAAALLGAYVTAIDEDPRAVELCGKNAEKFGVLQRVEIIHGRAPEALEGLAAERVFIGGGGRELPKIIAKSAELLKEGGRVVIDVVTLESLRLALEELERLGLPHEVVLIQASRGVKMGNYTVMTALNPVYIISADVPAKTN